MILYLVRMILIAIYLALMGILGTILPLIRPKNPENLKIIARIFWRGIYILGIKFIVRHEERLNVFPHVIVSNHQENMDVFVGARMIPKRTVSIGKRSILFIPFFGIFYYLTGNILINRGNKKSAIGTMDMAAKQILEKNISVWVLPEGTRSKGRGVLPFKKGAFVTAIKAQVPVIPISISTYKGVIDFKKWHAGTVIIEVGEKIETKNMNMENVNDLKDQAYHVIKNKVAELDAEIKAKHL